LKLRLDDGKKLLAEASKRGLLRTRFAKSASDQRCSPVWLNLVGQSMSALS